MAWGAVYILSLLIIFPAVLNGAKKPPISDQIASRFKEFLHNHKIVFHNSKEHDKRQSIFADNLDKIQYLNDKKAGGSDVVFGVTPFSHLTFEEFKQQMLYPDSFYASTAADVNLLGNNTIFNTIVEEDDNQKAVPKEFDWRKSGIVTPIRNQGSCGSCWAFCTAAALESAYLYRELKTKGSAKSNITLSTQQLVSCEKHSSGCGGGYVKWAMDYISTNGLHYETKYPYTGTSQTCSTVNGDVVKPDGVHNLNSYTEEQMKTYLYNYGPMTNGFSVGNEFQFYVRGIFNPASCPTTVNHAMLIVGYGVANNTPYWLIKNQYGPNWGESGYIRVICNANKCSLNTENYAPYYNIK